LDTLKNISDVLPEVISNPIELFPKVLFRIVWKLELLTFNPTVLLKNELFQIILMVLLLVMLLVVKLIGG